MDNYDIERRDNPRILFSVNAVLTLILVSLAPSSFFLKILRRYERRQTERRFFFRPRGDIYDRNGQLLVGNRPHYSASVILDDLRPEFRAEYARLIKDARKRIQAEMEKAPERFAKSVPPLPDYNSLKWEARTNVIDRYLAIIGIHSERTPSLKESKIVRHFNEQLLLPLPLAQDLNRQEYAKLIESLPVQSPINVHTSSARYYPYRSAAAHTLGYVQNVNPDLEQLPKDGIKNFTFKIKLCTTGL